MSHQKVCYSTGDRAGGLDMEEQIEGEDSLLAYLLPWQEWPVCLSRGTQLVLGKGG